MKRAKFYQLIIGIMATMNIVTLVFFLSSQPQYKGDLSLTIILFDKLLFAFLRFYEFLLYDSSYESNNSY